MYGPTKLEMSNFMIEFCVPEFFPKPLGPYALWVRGTAKNFGLRDVGLTILIQIFGKKNSYPHVVFAKIQNS